MFCREGSSSRQVRASFLRIEISIYHPFMPLRHYMKGTGDSEDTGRSSCGSCICQLFDDTAYLIPAQIDP